MYDEHPLVLAIKLRSKALRNNADIKLIKRLDGIIENQAKISNKKLLKMPASVKNLLYETLANNIIKLVEDGTN